MKTLWPTVLLTLAATCASAADKAQAAKPAADKPKMVCFSDPTTGSHIKKRTCMTEGDYAARKKADQEAAMRLRSGGSSEKQKTAGGLR